jgi:hypothetical protein
MPSCFNADVPLCVNCGQLQPAIEPGDISRRSCDACGKVLEVYRNDEGLYQIACSVHNIRQMNGVPVCTLCGYEPDPGP